jgi:hypothetical protein
VSPRALAVIEDVEWMARWGEGLEMAARRTTYANAACLERVLAKWGRQDLATALKANDLPLARTGAGYRAAA